MLQSSFSVNVTPKLGFEGCSSGVMNDPSSRLSFSNTHCHFCNYRLILPFKRGFGWGLLHGLATVGVWRGLGCVLGPKCGRVGPGVTTQQLCQVP